MKWAVGKAACAGEGASRVDWTVRLVTVCQAAVLWSADTVDSRARQGQGGQGHCRDTAVREVVLVARD